MNENAAKPEDKKKPEAKELKESELEIVTGDAAALQIDGIKGESQDDKHKGEIDIESF